MATKNKTRFAILGVLSLGKASGYDIKRFCDHTVSNFWHENYGHIYPVLKTLLDDGLIYQEEGEASARKKVYCITETGREEFLQWLSAPVEYQPVRSELLLKLFFGSQMPKGDMLQMLEEVQERNTRNLEGLTAIYEQYVKEAQKKNKPIDPFILAPLRYGILSFETNIRWCEETLDAVNQK